MYSFHQEKVYFKKYPGLNNSNSCSSSAHLLPSICLGGLDTHVIITSHLIPMPSGKSPQTQSLNGMITPVFSSTLLRAAVNSEARGKVKVVQSSPTLCDSMDYTVYGILQARTLEPVAFPFSRNILTAETN